MIKVLYNIFGEMPMIGPAVKAAYVGVLIKQSVTEAKKFEPKPELKEIAEGELDSVLNDQANSILDKVIAESGIPQGSLVDMVKEKAAEKVVNELKERVKEKLKNKL